MFMLKVLMQNWWRAAVCGLVLACMQLPSVAQTTGGATNQQTGAADQQIPPAIAKELDAMRKRIDELETELKTAKAPERPTTPATSAKMSIPVPQVVPATAAPAASAMAPE